MCKSAVTTCLLAILLSTAHGQSLSGSSVSVSGNTVTVSANFDAGWSSDSDPNCPSEWQTFPFGINSVSYQVDGGTSITVPGNDIQQSQWATECGTGAPDNQYSIQFSYNQAQPGSHSVQITVQYDDYSEGGKDSGSLTGDSLQYSISGGILIDGGNLDDSNNWNYCISSSCNPIPPSYFDWPLGHVSSPSTDGSSLESYQYGPPNWGILYYYTHYFNSQEVNTTNYQVQWQYYVDSSNYVQALEFDFPVIWNNQAFYFGSQCVQSANWQYWDVNVRQWKDFSPEVPCTQTSAATWHTLVWYGTRTTSQYTYQTLEIDGVQYAVNTTLNAPSNGTGIANNTITVQFQPDGNSANPNQGYHEYIDNVQAWVW